MDEKVANTEGVPRCNTVVVGHDNGSVARVWSNWVKRTTKESIRASEIVDAKTGSRE